MICGLTKKNCGERCDGERERKEFGQRVKMLGGAAGEEETFDMGR